MGDGTPASQQAQWAGLCKPRVWVVWLLGPLLTMAGVWGSGPPTHQETRPLKRKENTVLFFGWGRTEAGKCLESTADPALGRLFLQEGTWGHSGPSSHTCRLRGGHPALSIPSSVWAAGIAGTAGLSGQARARGPAAGDPAQEAGPCPPNPCSCRSGPRHGAHAHRCPQQGRHHEGGQQPLAGCLTASPEGADAHGAAVGRPGHRPSRCSGCLCGPCHGHQCLIQGPQRLPRPGGQLPLSPQSVAAPAGWSAWRGSRSGQAGPSEGRGPTCGLQTWGHSFGGAGEA